MRRRNALVVAGVAALSLVAGATVVSAVPVPTPDPCAIVGTVNTTKLAAYDKCRFDRLERAIPGNQTVTVMATPAPVTVTSTAPAETVTVTETVTAEPSAPTTAPGTTEPAPPVHPSTLKGWELTATNIGLAPFGLSCSNLPVYTGPAKPAQGARISNYRITVPLNLSNGDIIVEKSCIQPTRVGDYINYITTSTICEATCWASPVGKVIIRDSEIDGSRMTNDQVKQATGFIGVGTIQRNYIHDLGDGIAFFETGLVHSALAEQNYVTRLRTAEDAHNEAATIRDFRKDTGNTRTVKFLNNRLDASIGRNVTGGLFIQPTWVDIHNVTVAGNYIEGEGYNLYLENSGGTYSNVTATDNRFRPTGWGPSATPSGPGYTLWADNYLYDPTKPDGKGATVNP